MQQQTVLLTGVTGQVVSEFAIKLQEQGYRILYLIRRSRDGESAQERLEKILPVVRDEMDIAIEGDITLPLGGFSLADVVQWSGKIDKILHGAAAISFEEKDAEFVYQTNFGGTMNMLALADELGVLDFHYISTAYISGSAPVFGEEDLDIGQSSFNAYERSKMAAEKLIHDWQERHGDFTIYRLPTVLGRSDNGKVLTYHSYYGFFMPFWRMLKSWRKRWGTDREECVRAGVTFNEKMVMNIPLFIDRSETSVLNMVCVDWVADTMAKLFAMQSEGKTYHLVDQNPMLVKDVIDVSLEFMDISGIVFDKPPVLENKPLLAKIQAGVSENIRIYQQYIKHGSIFTCDVLMDTLGDSFVEHPVVDAQMLYKMLNYAMHDDFGRKQK